MFARSARSIVLYSHFQNVGAAPVYGAIQIEDTYNTQTVTMTWFP